MSILPSQNLASTSSFSSQDHCQNPNSNHGIVFASQPESEPSFSEQTQTFGSLRISNSEFSVDATSGSMAQDAEDSGGSSKEVNESGNVYGKKILAHQNIGTNPRCEAARQAGAASAPHRGKSSRILGSSRAQQTSGSTNIQGGTAHPAGKKTQVVNGNHLLNFHYDPVSRPRPRAPPPPKRRQKRKPYNKDLFLQANYKFVVLDSGDYTPELMDPDKMLQWEDIICVKYSTPLPVQCPICLQSPLCPQITSCGHIFCFPCILQYFLMGEDNHKGEFWKKCPLCFLMISSKDLCTIYIENVKQHSVGDTIELMLLTRQKDSPTLSLKNNQVTDANEKIHDSFSKFTFTSDADLSVREAMSDLDSWLAKVDSGLVDDLEKLPYVCAAMEHLEQRKNYWNGHWASIGNKASKYSDCGSSSYGSPPTANAVGADDGAFEFVWGTLSNSVDDKSKRLESVVPAEIDGVPCLDQTADMVEFLEDQDGDLLSSYDGEKSMQRHPNGHRDIKYKDSFNFYQAVDGQHLILHPLNMKCLMHHYGNYDRLPHRINGKILQLETVTQSEAMRRRYRHLSHFSLTTTYQLCEIDLSEILPPEVLYPFKNEIENREKQRKRLSRREQKEKIAAEAAGTDFVPIPYNFVQSSHDDSPIFSMDDFEALGSSTVTSSSPPTVGGRQLFSSVARLGFAAGHDSPALRNEEVQTRDSPGVTGLRNASTPSFANIISRSKPEEAIDVSKMNDRGKKGKKPSRVLLSTAGGRRY